jgi:hypothetical protein
VSEAEDLTGLGLALVKDEFSEEIHTTKVTLISLAAGGGLVTIRGLLLRAMLVLWIKCTYRSAALAILPGNLCGSNALKLFN